MRYYYFTAFGPLTTVDFRGGARGRRRRGRAAEQLPAGGEGRRQEAEEVGGEAGQESPTRGETWKREPLYHPPAGAPEKRGANVFPNTVGADGDGGAGGEEADAGAARAGEASGGREGKTHGAETGLTHAS